MPARTGPPSDPAPAHPALLCPALPYAVVHHQASHHRALSTMATVLGGTSAPAEDSHADTLRIEMLGAGQEVGRSCCVLTYNGA